MSWLFGVMAGALLHAAPVPVVVELFTSEGCSSCPQADLALSALAANQPLKGVTVIPLSLHVDYWNRLGWEDPFSQHAFTERQSDYQAALHSENVYTPEMVVDGRKGFVGELSRAVMEVVAASRTAKRDVTVKGNGKGQFVVEVPAGAAGEVLLALTEDGIVSHVTRGENSGRDLPHTAVTRALKSLGKVGAKPFHGEVALTAQPGWKRENLHVVVLVQDPLTQGIQGAATVRFVEK